MKLLAVLAIISISFSACGETIRGNGNVTKEEHSVAGFEALSTAGMFEIVLVKGEPHIVVETDENLLEHIRTEVSGEKLVISSDNKFLDATKLLITVYYSEINAIELSGATEIKTSEVLTGEHLSLDISGAAEAELSLDVKTFEIDLSGAAELKLDGRAESASFDLSGAAEVKAAAFQVDAADIDISGGSEVEIHVTKRLNVDISGAGEVKYTGDPEVTKAISGAGVLKKK